ncbi:hypothetical protein LBMAG48_13990 [Phycisphaerae bacterium]|nr:hypothetical protein LBMAG48_13990 [Phycisphaerae bacterium]
MNQSLRPPECLPMGRPLKVHSQAFARLMRSCLSLTSKQRGLGDLALKSQARNAA